MSVRPPLDISKELEAISFKVLQDKQYGGRIRTSNIFKRNNINQMFEHVGPRDKSNNIPNDQYTLFHRAIKLLLICGQLVGIMPVTGIFQNDVTNLRFTWKSWRFVYSITVAFVQIIVVCCCLYKLSTNYVTLKNLGFMSFFTTACFTTLLFMRVAAKWPSLAKSILNSGLDKYIDSKVITRCDIACASMLAVGLLEHGLSIGSKLSKTFYCRTNETILYEEFLRESFPWYFYLKVPYNVPTGIFLQYINISATINWNYSDIFIVCISLYLTSLLGKINEKIAHAADKSYMSSSVWRLLREDYTRATRLVRLFDDTFSSVILLSFANNMFFICLQLFNVLNGINAKTNVCNNISISSYGGIERPIYLTYSVVFLFGRFLTVALVAAGVHTTAQAPANCIYDIPACAYCKEVQRFLDQVHGNVVALSGLQFFFITKELVLSVAGSIVTYELVLLQFNDEN